MNGFGGNMKKALKITGIVILGLLVVCLVIGLVITTTANDFEYIVDHETNTVTITGIANSKSYKVYINIPKQVKGYTVTTIAEYAFKDNEKVITVKIPSTVENIGQGAFYNCTKLTKIYGLGKCKNLDGIQNQTFYNCKSLNYILLPDGVTSIGEFAFKSCYQLKELQIPKTVEYIGKRAFDNCQSIKEIVIPEGIQFIEEGTFFSCFELTNVTLPEGLITIGDFAFANCYKLPTVKIPSTVKDIGNEVFNTCEMLKSLDFPNGVTAINSGMFIQCISLSHVSIPASVEYISFNAFDYCENLQEVSIDQNNSCIYFDNGAICSKKDNKVIRYLMGKAGESFTVPNGIAVIEYYAFGGNPYLRTLNVPKSVVHIGQFALSLSAIDTINYDGTVEEWQSIEKDPEWDKESANYTIYCTDGQIAKDGTVTYN